MYEHLKIYIAGPECFYPDGRKRLNSMRAMAEAYGFGVSLPNDNPRPPRSENPRENADNTFKNCADSMNETDIIIADLEMFRGTEPDGGTVYEIGMAYAKGCKCYAYTRDKRAIKNKHQKAVLKDGKIFDEDGRLLPEQNYPFNLMLTSSCKIVEGNFEDCLKVLVLDLEEESKNIAKRQTPAVDHTTGVTWPLGDRPRAYLAGYECFETNSRPIGDKMKELCDQYGIEGVWPWDDCPGVEVRADTARDIWEKMYYSFDRDQQHIRNCNVIIANLNDFHGYEPDSGTAFECGMAYQLGHKMYGFMDSTAPMIDRVPNFGEEGNYKDMVGNSVENFNYPLNLMFSSSMKIFEGKFEDIIKQVAIDLGTYKE